MALVLAEATGRRLGSIRALRWDDFDWEHSTIRWRAEADKQNRESVVPMPAALVKEIRSFQRVLVGLGGLCFPMATDESQSMRRDKFDKALRRAEKKAGLKPLGGGLWHAYRRAWATARKRRPVADVAAAGGWKDVETLIRCYQRPTNDVILDVMNEPTKVHEIRGARNG